MGVRQSGGASSHTVLTLMNDFVKMSKHNSWMTIESMVHSSSYFFQNAKFSLTKILIIKKSKINEDNDE